MVSSGNNLIAKFRIGSPVEKLEILENKDRILITTWMNNREEGDKNATYSHLLIYDKDKEKWSETVNPKNILDIGMLAEGKGRVWLWPKGEK